MAEAPIKCVREQERRGKEGSPKTGERRAEKKLF